MSVYIPCEIELGFTSHRKPNALGLQRLRGLALCHVLSSLNSAKTIPYRKTERPE